jgi:hypothetical protein
LLHLANISQQKVKPPIENFITEAFAWILENNAEFSIFFMERIISRLNCATELKIENHKWSTHPSGTFTLKETTSFACRTNAKAQPRPAAVTKLKIGTKPPGDRASGWSAKLDTFYG